MEQTTQIVDDQMSSTTVLGAAALATGAVLLTACGGGGGSGDSSVPTPPLPPALAFTAITITTVVNDATAAVSVSGQTASAGAVRFPLDGGGLTTTRAADPGYRQAERNYEHHIVASTGSETANATCYVSINPLPERALTGEPVLLLKHLLNRIAFAATEDDLARWMNVSYATAVDRLVDEATIDQTAQGPPGGAGYRPLTWQAYNLLSTAEKEAYDERKSALIGELYRWWMREICISRQPLLERMALFWHGLLVVSVGDVFEPRAAWDYLDLLRRNALGSYRTLITGIAKDPAMVMFLDSNSNRKGRPNENFARELMELFTLGEGQVYTEQDVVEVAKCFTGWGLDESAALNQAFKLWQSRHEPGSKTVLGTTISFADSDPQQVRKDGEAVLDRILQESRVAIFICEKLWDEFIGGARDSGVIATWATTFRNAGYEIRPLLKAIFKHSAFTGAANRGNMLRSPVALIAAIFRPLGLEPGDYGSYHWRCGEQDQSLFNPPNVRGWIGGLSWITTRSLLLRREHLQWTYWEFVGQTPWKIPAHRRRSLETLWFATPPADRTYIDDAWNEWNPEREYIRRLMIDPAINCT